MSQQKLSSPSPAPAGSVDPRESEARRLRDQVASHLAAIVESSDDAIISKTLDGVIRTWNAGATGIFGYTADEMIGRPVTILIPPDRQDEEPGIIARLRAGERVDHFETVRLTKDGRAIDVSVTVSPVRDAAGEIVGASKVARDITVQKSTQRELREAKELAECAGRAKDLFLSVLSHELRTPLTPVLASLSLLEARGDLPSDLRHEIGMIRHNVETEARLVDDLLDLTQITRGRLQLQREVVDLHGAVRNALAMLRHDAAVKSLRMSPALDATEHHVYADPGRLEQIFLNLLSNAVKFTPAGGEVSLHSSNVNGSIRIDVRDTGVGIPADVLPMIFGPFEQGDDNAGGAGLGLGLSISRALVEMHGGTLSAASEGAGRGATLTVELKTVPSEGMVTAGPVRTVEPELRARILLLEDHEDTRRVMTRLLASFGCTVTSAATVAEALNISEANQFDLLVSDIGLPDGSGNDVMRQLALRMKIKGIALSGFGQAEDLRRSGEAGFEAHLVKPINLQSLRAVLEKLLSPAD